MNALRCFRGVSLRVQEAVSDVFPNAVASEKKNITIIQAQVSGGQRHKGVAVAPVRLAEYISLPLIRNTRVDVKFVKPVCYTPEEVLQVAYATKRPGITLTLGGDHSVGVGTVGAQILHHGPANLGLLWVDAHADLNTKESSMTKNTHGMAVAQLLGIDSYTPTPPLPFHNIFYLGIRDLDPFEVETIRNLGIKYITGQRFKEIGVAAAMAEVASHFEGCQAIHCSFDIDVADVQGTGTPVPGGFTTGEALGVGRGIADLLGDRLVGVDMVEVNIEDFGNNDRTLELAGDIILEIINN